MSRIVTLPPENGLLGNGRRLGGWWHEDAEPGRIVCDLCPRDCHLRPGDRGFCFVRENDGGRMVLSTYGRSTGFCIDPIEKKPLNHFYPGTSVLSFGTAGCNLGCKFCQNWSISKSREIEQLSENASPEVIAQAALKLGCKSVAFTYNDPVIWAEYAIDTARACREVGVKAVAVTAGYITPKARPAFYEHMDAANVDLKGFTEQFYRHLTLSHLEPVKETLRWLVHESPVWTEITNLIIPRENDSEGELKAMCDWILEALGPNVPVHFTAFHPDFRLMDRERTPAQTLLAAYDIATSRGLNYVYVGNIHARERQTTYCPACKRPLIERTGYEIERYELAGSHCRHCRTEIAGHFDDAPGDWGSRRQPVRIGDFEAPLNRGVHAGPAAISEGNLPMATTTHATAPPIAPVIDQLTAEQEQAIARAAVRALTAAVLGEPIAVDDLDLNGTADLPVLGAFVSLKRAGRLRSCCGFMGQNVPLAKALAHAARRTANEDHRFPPVAARELAHLDVDVWLLANQQQVEVRGEARLAAFEIGKHGLQIARGESRGLLLPGVAIEHGLDARSFLEHVCLKAELHASAWREEDTLLWTFEGRSIRIAVPEVLETRPASRSLPLSDADLPPLADHCRANLGALVAGATPSYYAPGLPDGDIHGLAISLLDSAGRELLQASRLSVRQSMPLQATLFNLTQNLAEAVMQQRIAPDQLDGLRVAISVMGEPALHGTVAEPDLRGIEPRRQVVGVFERNRSAAVYQPDLTAAELVAAAAPAAQIHAAEAAQVVTFEILTGLSQLSITHVPQPRVIGGARPAAVAGRFYPEDPSELSRLVDRCLAGQIAPPQAWPAVMLPHAGLVYSGRVAAQTLRRVEFPQTAIIIGPKHTPHGVDWAVAPHEAWSIPGATVPADPQLARALSQAIDGLQLDAAAHAQEHAIEVELPFIARLAPQTKVVGIVIGSGNLQRCGQFAAGLARVIRSLPQPPLLIISSDMNHFASDAENRRLDDMALCAMETLDPERLYKTVVANHISMCGVLPAVIVMQTLLELGKLQRVERVLYATSGDVSGQRDRVVGYAGVLLGP